MAQNIDAWFGQWTKEQLRNRLKEVGTMASNEMKEIRNSIIDEWFGEFDSISMKVAWVQKRPRWRIYDNMATLWVEAYVDIGKYNEKPKAEAWRSKYGGDLDSREYVLGLQLDQGIIGLPKESQAYPEHNWVNPNFHQRPQSLMDYIVGHSRFSDFMSKYQAMIEE